MSNKNPNPNDWNRGYTVASGRSPVIFWLGVGFLILVLGGLSWSYFFGG